MNNFVHWNRPDNNTVNNTCEEFIISKELIKFQPSANANHKCAASVLGDMRHSDWIKVVSVDLKSPICQC